MNESNMQVKEYFMELQNKLQDFRDNRGKKHDLAFVILSFFISILRCPGKINYSIIHRNMQRDNDFLKDKIGERAMVTISYSQLKRILSRIDYECFNSITQNYFNAQITHDGVFWKAIDGKELRGTIDKVAGEKRSENIIQQVSHIDRQSQLIGFYNGSKESEKTLVQNYFELEKNLQGQAYSFDALHTSASLLGNISEKNGFYLAQVKENQKFLLEECKHIHNNLQALKHISSCEKGHGRIENRQGFIYPLNVECLASRWKNSGIQTLLVIKRSRLVTKTKNETNETAYFISNKKTKETSQELFNAARQHWSVETDNYTRDVNFGEDEIRSFHKNTSRMMAVSISLVLNILRFRDKDKNIKSLREEISCDRNLINSCFIVN